MTLLYNKLNLFLIFYRISVAKGDPEAIKITTACSKYLFDNGGKDLVFLFNDFDELPEKLRTNSLIADILKRQVLRSRARIEGIRGYTKYN